MPLDGRLAIPNAGEIRLDGSPIHHWDPAQLGRRVGFLPQDVELFTGSVRDNIARMQAVDDEAVVKRQCSPVRTR